MRQSTYITLAILSAIPYTVLCAIGVFTMFYYEHAYRFVPFAIGVCCFWLLLFTSIRGNNIFDRSYWLLQVGMMQAMIYLLVTKHNWNYNWSEALFVIGSFVPIVAIQLYQRERVVNQSLQLKAKTKSSLN